MDKLKDGARGNTKFIHLKRGRANPDDRCGTFPLSVRRVQDSLSDMCPRTPLPETEIQEQMGVGVDGHKELWEAGGVNSQNLWKSGPRR